MTARRNLADFSDGSAETVLLDDLSSFDALPPCDLIYSLITLQHNTPPVIAHITGRLLDALRPEGVAILHIPLARSGYSFDLARYLASSDAGQGLEMHILPKNNLNDIGREAGCSMVASHGMGGTGDLYSEWVVYRRPAAA